MKHIRALWIAIALSCLGLQVQAEDTGQQDFESVRQCVMQNDENYCTSIVTPESKPLLTRFLSYKLMPCMPTDFSYAGSKPGEGYMIVKATMPAPDNRIHIIRLALRDHLLDVPESLRIGLGEKWQDKLTMAEQMFLFIRQSSGGNFNCDMLPALKKK